MTLYSDHQATATVEGDRVLMDLRDEHAIAAVKAYAESVETLDPDLADTLKWAAFQAETQQILARQRAATERET